MAHTTTGTINSHESYSKQTVLQRLGISQKFWDKMIADGLPVCSIGHQKWITGQALIDYMNRNAQTKCTVNENFGPKVKS
jgi:hypothetical protein